MQAVEIRHYETARSFLDVLRRSNDEWWVARECPWIFRGQYDADWKLEPAAFREPRANALTPLKEQLKTFSRFESALESDVWVQANAECELLHRFAVMATEVGFPVTEIPPSPRRSGQLLDLPGADYEDPFPVGIVHHYDHCCPQLRVAPIAQHHGIPTRLLDFTPNPLNAAFFAVEPSLRPNDGRLPTAIAVWAFDTTAEIPVIAWQGGGSLRVRTIRYPPEYGGTDDYVRAQSGQFILVRDAAQHRLSFEKWPLLDELLTGVEHNGPRPILRKLTLPYDKANELLKLLRRDGVSFAHLMPSLDNVARTVLDTVRTTR